MCWVNNGLAAVVNCFQISTLVEDSQVILSRRCRRLRCELLSNFYFSRGFTGDSGDEVVINGCELLSNFYFSRGFTGISRVLRVC